LENRSLLAILTADNSGVCSVPQDQTPAIDNHIYPTIEQAIQAAPQFDSSTIQLCGGPYDQDVVIAGFNPDMQQNKSIGLSLGNSLGDGFGPTTAQVRINGYLQMDGGALAFNINGNSPGSGYDQIVVEGRHDTSLEPFGVGLHNTFLSVVGSRPAGSGQALVLIDNLSTADADADFSNYAEGSLVVVNDVKYLLTYHYNADHDGHNNDVALIEIPANSAQEIVDPANSDQTALFVQGTSTNNTIELKPKDTVNVEVKINGVSKGIYPISDITGHIIIYGGSGDDRVTIDPHLTMPAVVFGEAGKDTLQAGGGPAILVGGDGDDALNGNSSNDILIGGLGKDNLHGNGANDVLIGGYTTFDTDLVAIMQLFSNPSLLVADDPDSFNINVFDDSICDTMDGNGGSDLYFANLTSPFKDSIKLTKDDSAIDTDPATA
jgi:Ca2+-binding RTX toxin-like protein